MIRSETLFRIIARLYGTGDQMKAGEYRIPRTLGVVEIIDRLVEGEGDAKWVVIPEGWTVNQVADLLEERHLVRRTAFLRAVQRRPSAYGVDLQVSRASLEGYLMPDTYKFPSRASGADVVGIMVRNWEKKVWKSNEAAFWTSWLTPEKIVVAASLIEREAKRPEDRARIASVIRNRLAKKMLLQIDATVLYALGTHKEKVLLKDLKTPSFYNTYRHKGLPPGPICSPGLKAIEAVLHPEDTEYLYYVAQPDGSHIFTRTGQEHAAAVSRVRQMAAALSGVRAN